MYRLSTFCCGCPIKSGGIIILVFHLLACLFLLGVGFWNVVLLQSLEYSVSVWIKVPLIILALSGVPIIILALRGLHMGIESCLRVYLWYLLLWVVLELVGIVYVFCFVDLSDTLFGIDLEFPENFGDAFLCGLIRVVGYSLGVLLVLLQMYVLWVVWSAREEIMAGRSSTESWDQLRSENIRVFGKNKRSIQKQDNWRRNRCSIWWPCSWPPCVWTQEVLGFSIWWPCSWPPCVWTMELLGLERTMERWGCELPSSYGYGHMFDPRWGDLAAYAHVDSSNFSAFSQTVVPGPHPRVYGTHAYGNLANFPPADPALY